MVGVALDDGGGHRGGGDGEPVLPVLDALTEPAQLVHDRNLPADTKRLSSAWHLSHLATTGKAIRWDCWWQRGLCGLTSRSVSLIRMFATFRMVVGPSAKGASAASVMTVSEM